MNRKAAISRTLGVFAILIGSMCSLPASPQDDSGGAVVLYHVHVGDTLIGLGRRLLIQSSLWRAVASSNRIREERRLQPDSELRIPIAWLRWTSRGATVRGVSGGVASAGRSLAVGDTLDEGSELTTEDDGSATLELSDGSELTIPPGTHLTLERSREAAGTDAPDIQVGLDHGHVEVLAHKHRDVGRFEIRTPVAVTAVRGTHFRTHFAVADGSATAETLEGVVGVTASEQTLPLAAGFGTRAREREAPLPPVPLLPAPDLSGLPSVNTRSDLEVAFGAVAKARAYRVQLSRTEDFLSFDRDVVFDQPEGELRALPDGKYWLRVRAIDQFGLEGLDTTRPLEQHVLPDSPHPVDPVTNADLIGPARLTWSSSGARYRLEISRSQDLSDPVLAREIDTPQFTVTDLSTGRYFWRVAALNESGESGPWSAQTSFTERPSAPTIALIRVTGKHAVELTGSSIPGYAGYFQVAKDPEFSAIVKEGSIADHALDLGHFHPGAYFVRVRWVDSDGYQGPYGPTRRFVVPLPAWLWLIVPVAAIAAYL
jgi:hypothetical protein